MAKPHILVIDDSASIRRLIEICLRALDVTISSASDGLQGLDAVKEIDTEVRNEAGVAVPAELWTTCFTPRELRLMARAAGLRPLAVHGVTPGGYGPFPPSTDEPEFLLVAERSTPDER